MEYFPRYWPFVRGNQRLPVDAPHKASGAELWCVFLSTPKQMVEQPIDTPVIWDTTLLIMTSL